MDHTELPFWKDVYELAREIHARAKRIHSTPALAGMLADAAESLPVRLAMACRSTEAQRQRLIVGAFGVSQCIDALLFNLCALERIDTFYALDLLRRMRGVQAGMLCFIRGEYT